MSGGDIDSQLAQAAATIGALRDQLAEANARAGDADGLKATLDAAQEDARTARAALAPLQARVTELEGLLKQLPAQPDPGPQRSVQQLQARIDELEKLMGPPAAGSGLIRVVYDDGRVKWAAPDGNKFVLQADAQRHLEILKWLATGLMTENAANAAVDRGLFLGELT